MLENSTTSNLPNQPAGNFFETVAQSYHPAKLSRAIFDAESPEKFVAALPAQALYMAIQHVGLESAGELISLATVKQYRSILDFELWNHDSLDEDRFWRWLEAIDEVDSLEPTEKFLAALDYQLLAVLFAKHLDHFTSDDGNDQPPGPHFYTPNQGFTWIHIKLEDPLRHRLFGKLLAIIYETKSELFYQLLGIPMTTSETALEEAAYEEKNARLREFGIPSREEAWESQSVLNPALFLKALAEDKQQNIVEVALGTAPIAIDTSEQPKVEQLRDKILELGIEANLEVEISYLINTALVIGETSFADIEGVQETISFIRDTLNLSIEYLEERSKKDALTLYQSQGTVALYRVGLWLLNDIKTKARRVNSYLPSEDRDEALRLVFNSLTKLRPYYPELLEHDISTLSGAALMKPTVRPFRTFAEVQKVRGFLTSLEDTLLTDQPKIES